MTSNVRDLLEIVLICLQIALAAHNLWYLRKHLPKRRDHAKEEEQRPRL